MGKKKDRGKRSGWRLRRKKMEGQTEGQWDTGVMEWQCYEAKTKGLTEKSAKITENAPEKIHIQINKAVRISQDQLLRSRTHQANVIFSFDSISRLVFKGGLEILTALIFSIRKWEPEKQVLSKVSRET